MAAVLPVLYYLDIYTTELEEMGYPRALIKVVVLLARVWPGTVGRCLAIA